MTYASGKPSQWRIDFGLVFVALIWGSTFVLVKQALDDISTLLFLTLRFSIASVALLLLFWNKLRTEDQNFRHSIRGGVMAGVCLFSGYVLQTFGLKYTSAAKAGFITGMYIPFVPLFGALVYRKIAEKRRSSRSDLCIHRDGVVKRSGEYSGHRIWGRARAWLRSRLHVSHTRPCKICANSQYPRTDDRPDCDRRITRGRHFLVGRTSSSALVG